MLRLMAVSFALLVVALSVPVRGETVEEVEKSVVDAHSRLHSYTCDAKTVQSFDMGGGNKMTADYSGTVEWIRKGDKQLSRQEMKGHAVQAMGGEETKMEVSIVMISDGEAMYTLSTQMGQTMATKQKPDASMTGDPKKIFERLHADSNLKVLPDAKVEGDENYVLEIVPKSADPGPIAKSTMYFSKKLGLNTKVVGLDKDGKEVFTTTISNVKVNSDIPADRFVFKAPEGVQVMDMTGSQP